MSLNYSPEQVNDNGVFWSQEDVEEEQLPSPEEWEPYVAISADDLVTQIEQEILEDDGTNSDSGD